VKELTNETTYFPLGCLQGGSAPAEPEKSFNLKLSGNEVHCTKALLLLIKIMLCGEQSKAFMQ